MLLYRWLSGVQNTSNRKEGRRVSRGLAQPRSESIAGQKREHPDFCNVTANRKLCVMPPVLLLLLLCCYQRQYRCSLCFNLVAVQCRHLSPTIATFHELPKTACAGFIFACKKATNDGPLLLWTPHTQAKFAPAMLSLALRLETEMK